MIIKLSVNPTVVKTKEEAGWQTKFMVVNLDLKDEEDVKKLFSSHTYSFNNFKGIRKNSNDWELGYRGKIEEGKDTYDGMWGVVIDCDNDGDGAKYTIEDAEKEFEDYKYIIVTSASNNAEKSDYGIKERFHVILPFKIMDESLYRDKLVAKTVYSLLKKKFAHIPGADTCFKMQQKMFPFCVSENDIKNFHCVINTIGDWYSLNQVEIDKEMPRGTVKKVNMPRSHKLFISVDDVVILKDGTKKQIKEIKVKPRETVSCYCNFCDDINSQNASAFISINLFGEYFMGCHHCKATYWEQIPKYDPETADFHFHESKGAVFVHQKGEHKITHYIKGIGPDWIRFCRINRINPGLYTYLPGVEIIVDCKLPSGYNKKLGVYNLFEEPEILKKKLIRIGFEDFKTKCPRHYDILINVLRDDDTIKRFFNWVAYILMSREKAQTAWIVSSTNHGTGKNRVVENILGPFFGERRKQWVVTPGKNLGRSNFNKEDITLWLQAYNEVWKSGNLKENIAVRDDMKSAITDEDRRAEFKGIDAFYVKNITNFIFMSNHSTALLLEGSMDRRYNVVHMNEKEGIPLIDMPWWNGFKTMIAEIKDEREDFARYLLNIDVDVEKVHIPMTSVNRDALIASSATGYELVLKALETGDVDSFDLNEIFPYEDQKIAECKEAITKYNGLPATHIVKIFNYHWRSIGRMPLIQKLKSGGYESIPRIIGSKSIKIYRKR